MYFFFYKYFANFNKIDQLSSNVSGNPTSLKPESDFKFTSKLGTGSDSLNLKWVWLIHDKAQLDSIQLINSPVGFQVRQWTWVQSEPKSQLFVYFLKISNVNLIIFSNCLIATEFVRPHIKFFMSFKCIRLFNYFNYSIPRPFIIDSKLLY